MEIKNLIKKLNDGEIYTLKDIQSADRTDEAIYVFKGIKGELVAWSWNDFKGSLAFSDLEELSLNEKRIRKVNAIQGSGEMVYLTYEESELVDVLSYNRYEDDLEKTLYELIFGDCSIEDAKSDVVGRLYVNNVFNK